MPRKLAPFDGFRPLAPHLPAGGARDGSGRPIGRAGRPKAREADFGFNKLSPVLSVDVLCFVFCARRARRNCGPIIVVGEFNRPQSRPLELPAAWPWRCHESGKLAANSRPHLTGREPARDKIWNCELADATSSVPAEGSRRARVAARSAQKRGQFKARPAAPHVVLIPIRLAPMGRTDWRARARL